MRFRFTDRNAVSAAYKPLYAGYHGNGQVTRRM